MIEGLEELRAAQKAKISNTTATIISYKDLYKLALQNYNNLYRKDKIVWIPPKLANRWILKFYEPPF